MAYENEKIEFAVNVPTTLTLDSEPSRAKQYEKTYKNDDGSDYVVRSWMFFAAGKKLFFASEKLFSLLAGYKRGDTITITKMQLPGQREINWKVEVGSTMQATTNDVVEIVNRFEHKIDELKQLIISALNDKNPTVTLEQIPNEKEQQTTEGSGDIKDLGF